MVGSRIGALRERRGMTREELAWHTGIETGVLEYIETWGVRRVGLEALIRIADALKLSPSRELAPLLAANGPCRRVCQAIRVGPLSAGSTTLYRLFRRYHAIHECFPNGVIERAEAARRGTLPEAAVVEYLGSRDEVLGRPDIVSSFENLFVLPQLASAFPQAHFLLTVRDVFSWLDHTLRWIVWHNTRFGESHIGLLPGFRLCTISHEQFQSSGPVIVSVLLRYWRDSWHVMEEDCPPERSLLLQTHTILERRSEIARFLCIPPESLEIEAANQFKTYPPEPAIDRAWREWIPDLIDEETRALMRHLFPDSPDRTRRRDRSR